MQEEEGNPPIVLNSEDDEKMLNSDGGQSVIDDAKSGLSGARKTKLRSEISSNSKYRVVKV